jgi:lysophospholipase L1-like esterase
MTGEIPGLSLRIGVLGESTAAGCGVGTHEEGFAGCLARELAVQAGRPVDWEVVGQHGATARRIRYRLLSQLGENLDVGVLLAGVNDVLTRRTPEQWGEDLTAILEGLNTRARRVVVSGIPPFDAFPSVPTTLGRYLTARAGALDAVSRQIIARLPRATWVGTHEFAPMGPDFFARDRFHPSAAGYERWAQATAEHLERACAV